MTLPDPSKLSPEELAAQIVFPRLGSNIPPRVPVEEDAQRFETLLSRYPFGGLILFNGSLTTTPGILRSFQERSEFPLLVATDMEAGLGQQMVGATEFPHAMAFSHAGDEAESLVEEVARVAAREALTSGVHITLAPVADVHRNRSNPIISIRAFGADPETAARLSVAYVRAVKSEGMLATAKHFPGHGGTSGDSHDALPVVPDDLATLERTDLVPFRACIDAGVDLVMTAHVAVPAIDPSGRPATLSRALLHDLLRECLGFQGVVISDSMMMKGVQGVDERPAAALIAAGADVVLDPLDPEAAVVEITEAIKAGKLSRETVIAAASRVNDLRRRLLDVHGPRVFTAPGSIYPDVRPGSAAHVALADKAATEAATFSPSAHVQLRSLAAERENVAVVVVPSTRSVALTGPFLVETSRLAPEVSVSTLPPDDTDHSVLWDRIGRARHRILVLMLRPAAWHAYGLSDSQNQFVKQALVKERTLLAVLGSSELLEAYPEGNEWVCLHSDMPPSQRALARILFGSEH